MSMFKRREPSALQAQLESITNKGGFEADKTEWKLTIDKKTGEGSAVIRFLSPSDVDGKEDWPTFVKLTNHGIKRDGKWYIQNCSSTHGDYDSCPVCEWIKAQNWDWNNPVDKKAMADSGTGRKQSIWANILVVKDPANKDAEGKVFKTRIGTKIFAKVLAAAKGDEDMGEKPLNVTDVFEGANFLYKSKKDGAFLSYDDSKFQTPSAIEGIETEAVQQAIVDGMMDLRPLVAPDQFKPYSELKPMFDRIMGIRGNSKSASKADDELDQFASDMSNFEASTDTKVEKKVEAKTESKVTTVSDTDVDAELEALLNDL